MTELIRGTGIGNMWREMSRRWLLAGGAAALLVLAPLQAVAGESGARAFVDGLGAETLRIIRAENIDTAERQRRFRALFTRNFDTPAIGRFVLGRHWSRVTPEEQKRYLDLMRDYVSTIYAVQFSGYQGVSFRTAGERETSPGESVVQSQIDRPGQPPIRTVFRVVKSDGGYKIIDVMVEEVSLILTKREEFSSVLTREGINGVMTRMQAAIEAMQGAKG